MRNFIILLISITLLQCIILANADLESVADEREELELLKMKEAAKTLKGKLRAVAEQIINNFRKGAQCAKESRAQCIWQTVSFVQEKLSAEEADLVFNTLFNGGNQADAIINPKVQSTVEQKVEEEVAMANAEDNITTDNANTANVQHDPPMLVAPDAGYTS